ncbi:MAG: Asp-tRNA(Asn)/Glu-tRNA(Gln) amidotransferase subunit GatC [Nanoarchaeota archaeon]|nr:Asp-tRNA(Asn)/Glu-tRNA(Gln) amidotransferase subunit GatC [Nanoarchaeota archaeon]
MIDEAKVKHVAELARLRLSSEEVTKFARQLNDVIESFKILDEVNVEGVEPSFHPIKTENVLREDNVEKCLDKKTVFKLACHKEDDYFKTPKIV